MHMIRKDETISLRFYIITVISIFLLLIFTGCVKQKKKYRNTSTVLNGLHTITYKDGSKYTGMFRNGKRDGRGTYTWKYGEYFGDFVNGEMTGQGEIKWTTGNYYKGAFLNGKRHGSGRFEILNGAVYSGTFKNGEMTGEGTYTWPTGIKYIGKFIKGEMTGQGVVKWPDGSQYVGAFNGHTRHKKGYLKTPGGKKLPGNLQFCAQIKKVMKNSNGENNGLKTEDIIAEYDGVPIINGHMSLISLINQTRPESRVEMTVIRKGEKKAVELDGGAIGIEIYAVPVFEPDMAVAVVPLSPPDDDKPVGTTGSKQGFGDYNALIIGINDYQFLPDLNTAENDARSVSRLLKNNYGFKVTLLMNPTRAKIISALSGYRKRLKTGDNMLIYYAGHGWLDKDANEGYWLPADATREDEANWISNATINSSVRAMKAKHVMVVADSCYSGKLVRGLHIQARTPDYLQRISKKKARVVLTSGGLEPVADGGGAGMHSVFASAFLGALKENTSILDGTSLYTKIRRPVMVNADQTPEYADIRKTGHAGGDFLFVRQE